VVLIIYKRWNTNGLKRNSLAPSGLIPFVESTRALANRTHAGIAGRMVIHVTVLGYTRIDG
jgi:hypothetical protein